MLPPPAAGRAAQRGVLHHQAFVLIKRVPQAIVKACDILERLAENTSGSGFLGGGGDRLQVKESQTQGREQRRAVEVLVLNSQNQIPVSNETL